MSPLPTYESASLITVTVYTQLVSGGDFVKNLDSEIESYSDVIASDGGFVSCDISMKASDMDADEWLSNGIGRHIEVEGAGGETVWEGFVNAISVTIGSLTIERGKLNELCNRCSVEYTPIFGYDEETGEPITGTPTTTIITEDLESQEKYGIWEQVVSGGTVEQDVAEYIRDTYLEENKELHIMHHPAFGSSGDGEVIVSLSLRGYVDWLNAYIYEYGEYALSIEVSDKIKAVLAADPNGIFSSDTSHVNYNGVLVNAFENQNRKALDVIAEDIATGDISDNRWTFGVYEGRRACYKVIPDEIEYFHYISDAGQHIENIGNAIVQPWNVRPGKFAMLPDMMVGRLPRYASLRDDQRVLFIEQVTYTAPVSLDIQSSKVRELDQYLAKFGV